MELKKPLDQLVKSLVLLSTVGGVLAGIWYAIDLYGRFIKKPDIKQEEQKKDTFIDSTELCLNELSNCTNASQCQKSMIKLLDNFRSIDVTAFVFYNENGATIIENKGTIYEYASAIKGTRKKLHIVSADTAKGKINSISISEN